jgi:LacI family transcriptional regulator
MAKQKDKVVTIYDIASKLGISSATVSKVLNGKGNISAKTIEEVLNVSNELGYKPNQAARSLITKKTMQIMLAVPNIKDSFFLKFIEALNNEFRKNGYALLINNTDHQLDEETKILSSLKNNFVDGLVMISINFTETHFNIVKTVKKPVVLCSVGGIGWYKDNVICDCVGVDTQKGIYLSTKHLIEQGYRKIAFLGLPMDTEAGRERYAGYETALKEAGLQIKKSIVYTGGIFDDFGYNCGKEIAAKKGEIEAICTSTDQMVMGLYDAFEEENISVPEDIAIIGMDNIPEGRRCHPKLSTVDLSQGDLGDMAAKLLFERIKGDNNTPKKIIFEPRLVIRDSCKKTI